MSDRTYHATPISLAPYDLSLWTPIATQERLGGPWTGLEGSPLTVTEAQRLRDQGTLLQAQKKRADGMTEMVVKTKRAETPGRITR